MSVDTDVRYTHIHLRMIILEKTNQKTLFVTVGGYMTNCTQAYFRCDVCFIST